MKNITYQNTGKIIMICLVYTLILTIAPLVGWSYYSLESSLIQCGVEWAERSWNVQSYNFTIFVTNYFFPVGIITYCSLQLLKIVKSFFHIFILRITVNIKNNIYSDKSNAKYGKR
jgi:hypothetical protein